MSAAGVSNMSWRAVLVAVLAAGGAALCALEKSGFVSVGGLLLAVEVVVLVVVVEGQGREEVGGGQQHCRRLKERRAWQCRGEELLLLLSTMDSRDRFCRSASS